MADEQWQQRAALLWDTIDKYREDEFLAAMGALVGELPPDDPAGPFELASAYDSTGHPDQAVPFYRQALASGLAGQPRRRATIQLASSLRNLGQPEESLALLSAELDAGSDELDDAVRAFLALTLTSLGRDREAAAIALTALAPHLPRYTRSVAAYATAL
jgi:tetratricopeptide (TPR) repeat protein